MSYSNIPPSLQDIFYKLSDRLQKLETGPNPAQYTADAAQTDAATALADAALALADASAAYTLAGTAIQGSTNTILNASNQMTAINANGITVYSGSSSTTGARVVLNSDGIAGFNGSGSTTFAIDATNGNVSMTGALFTGGTIYGGQLNINGNCIINTSGLLTATGATITGTIVSANGSIGGWTITSTQLRSGGTYIDSSTNIIYTTGGLYTSGQFQGSSGIYISSGASTFNANVTINGATYLYGTALGGTTTSSPNLFINSSSGLLTRYSSSSERYKENIVDIKSISALDPSALLKIPVRSFTYKKDYLDSDDARLAKPVPGFIAEEMQEIYPIAVDTLNGQPETWNPKYIIPGMLSLIQDHEARLAKLEGK